MVISSNYNRFYHSALLTDLYNQMIIKKRIVMSFDDFKQTVKFINKSYPRHDNGDLVSTEIITNIDLGLHIEWIIKWAGHFGLSIAFVNKEWERILKDTK